MSFILNFNKEKVLKYHFILQNGCNILHNIVRIVSK